MSKVRFANLLRLRLKNRKVKATAKNILCGLKSKIFCEINEFEKKIKPYVPDLARIVSASKIKLNK